jgi:hypothetical protein
MCRATTCRVAACNAWRCFRWASSGRDRVGVQEGRAWCGRSCSAAAAGAGSRVMDIGGRRGEGSGRHGPNTGRPRSSRRRIGRGGCGAKATAGRDELGGAIE